MTERLHVCLAAGAVAVLAASSILFGGCMAAMPSGSASGEMHGRGGPGSVLSARAAGQFQQAMDLITQRSYGQAAERMAAAERTYREAGDERHTGETMFWQGFCCEKMNQADQAGRFYRRVMVEYPDTPAARQAAARLEALRPPNHTTE